MFGGGGESRMIASSFSSLFRINHLVISKPLLCLQKNELFHGLSCGLAMDYRKGSKFDSGRKKRVELTQTWRAVSTRPNPIEGDGVRDKLQSQEANRAISSTVTIPECESSNPEVLIEPVGPDTCPRIEGSKDDKPIDGSDKYSLLMEVGSSLVRFVKGKRGSTQEEIEKETGVGIIFPSSRKGDSIIVEGNSAESVTKAIEKIQIIIDKAVNSRYFGYSHFVSLPLAIHPGLVDKLVNFQNTILGTEASDKNKNLGSGTSGDTSDEEVEDQQSTKASKVNVNINTTSDQDSTKAPLVAVEVKAGDADTPVQVKVTSIPLVSYSPKESKAPASETSSSKLIDKGIEKFTFIKPKTFHLTVLMLKLWNQDRVNTAAEVLQSVSSKVMDALENRPILIKFKGLDCMRGSMAKARILYAPVEEIGGEGRLLRACQVINDAFIKAGLVTEKDAQQKLKLHATLMNVGHRKRKKNSRQFDSFDARGIFDLYGSEEWGEYPIREAHLSQRFVFDENGYYHCCAAIPFPDEMPVD